MISESSVFPMGLSMLWESVEPRAALQERFGLADLEDADRWLRSALAERWGIDLRVCHRILLSATNAIAWLQTDRGALVAKCSNKHDEFARLAAIAELLQGLDHQGLPVAPPLASVRGERRVVIESGTRPLSMAVQPLVEGDLLDVADSAAVHAAGACLARLHRALSTAADPLLGSTPRTVLDLPQNVSAWLDAEDNGRAPVASARLRKQVAVLPMLDVEPQLVHNDYRASNLVTVDSQVAAVLDFDDLGQNHRVLDLANAAVLLGTRFTHWQPTPAEARTSLLAGYRSVQPLTDAEERWLEALILWRGLQAIPPGDDPAGWAGAVGYPYR